MWGAAILILCIAAWLWFVRDETRAPAASPDTPPGASLPNHSPPPLAATPATVVLPPAPSVAVPQRPTPVAPAEPSAVVRVPGPAARVPVPVAQPATQSPAAAAARADASSAAPPASDRIYNFADLPMEVQQAFPKLAISGGVYSANVAQRMLIVNGQVFNEGSQLAPGVVLEQMRPNSAVLRFRGLRLAQPY